MKRLLDVLAGALSLLACAAVAEALGPPKLLSAGDAADYPVVDPDRLPLAGRWSRREEVTPAYAMTHTLRVDQEADGTGVFSVPEVVLERLLTEAGYVRQADAQPNGHTGIPGGA